MIVTLLSALTAFSHVLLDWSSPLSPDPSAFVTPACRAGISAVLAPVRAAVDVLLLPKHRSESQHSRA